MKTRPVLALVPLTLLALGIGPCSPSVPDCRFGAGALPVDTLPPGTPHGDAIPIQHIVVLMQENRSFDHYLDQLFRENAPPARRLAPLPPNPDPLGGPPIHPFHQTHVCEVADLNHSWDGTHNSWDNGQMDGFTAANENSLDPNGSRTMGYHDGADLPFYYALYSTFAMGDRYFASVLGPTYPNRLYLFAATSFGHIKNDFPKKGEYSPSIFDRLDDGGVSWKVYYSDLPFTVLLDRVIKSPAKQATIDQFYVDAAAGTLPQVSVLEPAYFGTAAEESDEHPPSDFQVGQNFVAGVIQALFASPNWPTAALFLTYDEHGGYYDHVPPPAACVPGDKPPMLQPGNYVADFDHFGVRVPFVVISPFSKPHFLSHVPHDHTSITRFIEARFDLPALTGRDANSVPPFEFFDFEHPAFLTPPSLPDAPIDEDQLAQCLDPGNDDF
jgi:phospholipase C